jgi:hypothetical protein
VPIEGIWRGGGRSRPNDRLSLKDFGLMSKLDQVSSPLFTQGKPGGVTELTELVEMDMADANRRGLEPSQHIARRSRPCEGGTVADAHDELFASRSGRRAAPRRGFDP